ncbi:MAG: hypothetical protein JST89_18025 [Cyanobacteria bacterium SZAS-4]|nr:hypothetical protein [Cyanobacteria bacterium SZAS-4]
MDETLCSVCTGTETRLPITICLACALRFERLVKSNKTTKSDSCMSCSPILQIPGTPPFTVATTNGISICVECIADRKNSKKRGSNVETANIIQFPPRKND